MEYKEVDKRLDANLCEKCPARKSRVFSASLRGSSFRGRQIEDGEPYETEINTISVRGLLVARIVIANIDKASAEHDAEVITSVFEDRIAGCTGPELELASTGLRSFCTPANNAVDEFMAINY